MEIRERERAAAHERKAARAREEAAAREEEESRCVELQRQWVEGVVSRLSVGDTHDSHEMTARSHMR